MGRPTHDSCVATQNTCDGSETLLLLLVSCESLGRTLKSAEKRTGEALAVWLVLISFLSLLSIDMAING